MEQGKVVKCNKCALYFMHTEKDTKCPFCHTQYGGVKVKAEEKTEDKPKEKKEVKKTQKESFKIWKS